MQLKRLAHTRRGTPLRRAFHVTSPSLPERPPLAEKGEASDVDDPQGVPDLIGHACASLVNGRLRAAPRGRARRSDRASAHAARWGRARRAPRPHRPRPSARARHDQRLPLCRLRLTGSTITSAVLRRIRMRAASPLVLSALMLLGLVAPAAADPSTVKIGVLTDMS